MKLLFIASQIICSQLLGGFIYRNEWYCVSWESHCVTTLYSWLFTYDSLYMTLYRWLTRNHSLYKVEWNLFITLSYSLKRIRFHVALVSHWSNYILTWYTFQTQSITAEQDINRYAEWTHSSFWRLTRVYITQISWNQYVIPCTHLLVSRAYL